MIAEPAELAFAIDLTDLNRSYKTLFGHRERRMLMQVEP